MSFSLQREGPRACAARVTVLGLSTLFSYGQYPAELRGKQEILVTYGQ